MALSMDVPACIYCKRTFVARQYSIFPASLLLESLNPKILKVMKKVIIALACFFSGTVQAQQRLAVFDLYSDLPSVTPIQLGNLTRLEVDKFGKYEVLDRFDLNYFASQKNLKISDCYGKSCMEENGKALGVDKVLGGSVEQAGSVIVVNLKLIDVDSSRQEKSVIKEFIAPASEIKLLIELSLREMFGLENDKELLKKLTQKEAFESTLTNPYAERLKLNGPRMGFTVFTGTAGKILQAPKSRGGYDARPVMFQFGYQFETQYLNEGNFQALFEFIPTITGIDQGMVIPSFSLLNGLRNNKNGWEFAFGPTFSFIRRAEGFYDGSGQWTLAKDVVVPDGTELEKRLDSRGTVALSPSFIIAAGKSFRSGRLNIPLNVYVIPAKNGLRVGASFGFNGKKNS